MAGRGEGIELIDEEKSTSIASSMHGKGKLLEELIEEVGSKSIVTGRGGATESSPKKVTSDEKPILELLSPQA